MMEVTELTENTTPHYSTVTTLQSTDTRHHQYSRESSPPNVIQEGIPGRGRIPPRATSGAPGVWFYS